eukprot:scaffold26941_cov49-Cyclotella_meneghiniana.AAC.6
MLNFNIIKRRSSIIHPFYSPYKSVLCSFDLWNGLEDEDFMALPTERGQKCGPVEVAQNF